MEAPGEFPPFEDSQRPTCDAQGRQLAAGTFVRWLAPGQWLDDQGRVHYDVVVFHRWLGWPLDEDSIRETTRMIQQGLEAHALTHPQDGPQFIVVHEQRYA